MWLNGVFHLEICNFLVLLALHNYISCHLSHCGIPRQIYFSLRLSYYRGSREAGLANCFTAAGTLFVEGTGQLFLQRSLLNILHWADFSCCDFEVEIFLLKCSIAFWKGYPASPGRQRGKGTPLSFRTQEQQCQDGTFKKVQQGDAFRMLRYWLAPS